ncbi:MAG: hypothetical protein AAF126_05695 [Chloroflexota bacterium]
MTQIFIFIAFVVAGYGAGAITGINPIDLAFFEPFAGAALVIGLYGSVVGIDLTAIQKRRRLAIVVITIAVPLQILATGALMWLIYPLAISWLIAVAMTQIDPLSVDTLLRDKDNMSEESKGILRVWASFDDPVTVLFGFLILLPLVTGEATDFDVISTSLYVVYNLLPAALIYGLQRYTKLLDNTVIATILLIVVLVFAFFVQGYLLAAIVGLLLRPLPEELFSRAIFVLYHLIVFIVGMALATFGTEIQEGIRLGFIIATIEFFVIQPLTTLIVFNGTPSDLLRISYAQQNGLTTLLMGIAFEALGIHILHILLPAIIIVNLMNLAVNRLYTWKERRGLIEYETPTPVSE